MKDESKDDGANKKSGKRRKQMARKGLHTSVDKNDSEDSDEVGEQEESVTAKEKKEVYQIVREDGTDIVYINFGAMLKSISRDDLTELYRIVMNRYGMDGLEDGFASLKLRVNGCINVVEESTFICSSMSTMLKMKLWMARMSEIVKIVENDGKASCALGRSW
ncbi:hypothetical protein Tco_0745894 [Tanacetum coccineum]